MYNIKQCLITCTYTLTLIVTTVYLIHTSCLYRYCSLAGVVDFTLCNYLFIEFLSTSLNDSTFRSPILLRLAATLDTTLNRYPGSFSCPTICLQNQCSFDYTKLVSVLMYVGILTKDLCHISWNAFLKGLEQDSILLSIPSTQLMEILEELLMITCKQSCYLVESLVPSKTANVLQSRSVVLELYQNITSPINGDWLYVDLSHPTRHSMNDCPLLSLLHYGWWRYLLNYVYNLDLTRP